MVKRCWRIRGYDGFESIFDIKVDIGQFTDDGIKNLLRSLAAACGQLSPAETVGVYARRKTKIATSLLHVHEDRLYRTYSCGGNPHVHATVVDQDGNRLEPLIPLEHHQNIVRDQLVPG